MKTSLHQVFFILFLSAIPSASSQRDNYCQRHKTFFGTFCLRRTSTTARNDRDPLNFCHVYSRRCGVSMRAQSSSQAAASVVEENPLTRYCLNETHLKTANSVCSRFPDIGPAFYNTCHRFLTTCVGFFRPPTQLYYAGIRARGSRAISTESRANLTFHKMPPRITDPELLRALQATQAARSDPSRGYLGHPSLSQTQYEYLAQKQQYQAGQPGVPNPAPLIPWVEQFTQLHPNTVYTNLKGETYRSTGFPSAGNFLSGLPFLGRQYPAVPNSPFAG